MRISWQWERWQVAAALALALVLGSIAVLAADGDDERIVEGGAAEAIATTTPPEVLGDVVVRERTTDRAAETTTTPPVEIAVATTEVAPVTTAAPAPAAQTETRAPEPAPAPEPTAAPSTTVAPEPVAVEVRRAPDSPELSVVLMREGTVVGSGTLQDVLRFEGLTAGAHVLQVEWDNGTVVDEENGTTISGHGVARYEIAVEPGVTVVTCSPDRCQVG